MIDIEGVTETENDEKNGVVKAEKNAGGVEVNQKNARKVDPQKEKEDREVTAKAPWDTQGTLRKETQSLWLFEDSHYM